MRKRSGHSWKNAWLWGRGELLRFKASGPLALHIEPLEQRMVMDAAGFVHTDPPEDPESIVGVAGVAAHDDHRELRRGTLQLRIDPLANDLIPQGSENLRIKAASATRLGHSVTISEDGRRLIYSAGKGGLQAGDTFYYIVESDDGKLGKANVNLTLSNEHHRNRRVAWTPPREDIADEYSLFEDAPQQRLDVLANDREFAGGEIVAIELQSSNYSGPLTESPGSGSMQIAEDGRALLYQSSQGFSGIEMFTYTVRNENGEEAEVRVEIRVRKPIAGIHYRDAHVNLDAGTGPSVSGAVYTVLAPTPETPRIVGFDAPDYVGEFVQSNDGTRIVYTPAADFLGSAAVNYTVRYGPKEYQVLNDTLHFAVQKSFLAVDNWFSVVPNSSESPLAVLENDPSWNRRVGELPVEPVELTIASVSAGDHGGQIRAADDGKAVLYQPAAGFTGDETFTYEVLASNGVRDSATVTVHVADSLIDPSGVDTFANEAELEQFLIDKAVARYMRSFGSYETRYASLPEVSYGISRWMFFTTAVSLDATPLGEFDHSDTNTQLAGVDEADIVETDGRYVYTFSSGELVIVDVFDTSAPRAVSFTKLESRFDLMYLQGDRMTLIRSGSVFQEGAEIVVLDISDRSDPTIVERTEIDGYIADSRAIGDRVHLVVNSSFKLPELGGEWIVEPVPPVESPELPSRPNINAPLLPALDAATFAVYHGFAPNLGKPGIWRHETFEEYLDRVRDSLIETSLPSFRSYDAAGELIDSALLTDATSVHEPVAGASQLVSLLTFDAHDDEIGPLAEATSFVSDANIEVFVSPTSAYVFAYDHGTGNSNIYKLDLSEDGSLPIVATGTIGGSLLNQFSVDEHEGYLRVATTEVRWEEIDTSWGTRRVQQQRFNNVIVLGQQGNRLEMVGEVTNLAPTESIFSVRFMGDRAFVVTFRQIDPLFALDMSDPTSPTVEGVLKIPGFSNYLHPVGGDYLIGIGRDANETTGQLGPLQITLFDVSDLSDPRVADQLTLDGTAWASSEAWFEHHAVSFFAESGVLAIPITWSEPADLDGETPGPFVGHKTVSRSAIWTFQVDVSNPDNVSIETTGRVEHEAATYNWRAPRGIVIDSWWGGQSYHPGSPARRSLRVGESLITVSNNYVKINDLHDPSIELGEVFIGRSVQDDTNLIDENSGGNALEVGAPPMQGPPDDGAGEEQIMAKVVPPAENQPDGSPTEAILLDTVPPPKSPTGLPTQAATELTLPPVEASHSTAARQVGSVEIAVAVRLLGARQTAEFAARETPAVKDAPASTRSVAAADLLAFTLRDGPQQRDARDAALRTLTAVSGDPFKADVAGDDATVIADVDEDDLLGLLPHWLARFGTH